VNRGAYLPWAQKLAVFSVCLWCQKVIFEMIEASHETWLFWDRPGMQELESGREGFENAKNTPLAARHTPLTCIKTGLLKGIVQRKLRWVESGVNRWVMLQYWGAGH
jgi:hypothetical protein